MTELSFKPGEIVDITIKGARVEWTNSTDMNVWAVDEVDPETGVNLGEQITISHTAENVTVERVAPAEWPPRQGDLWRDRHGHLHFAASYCPDYDDREDSEGIDADGIRVVLLEQGQDSSCTPGATMHRPERVNQRCGPLKLVHREDEQDGGDRG